MRTLIERFLYLLFILLSLSGCSEDLTIENVEQEQEPEKEYEYEPTQNIVSERYVYIDWEKSQILEANYKDGIFKLTRTSDTEKLLKGSVMTIVTDTSYCISIVTNIEKDKNTINAKTVQGSLCDIFSNTTIVLSSTEDSSRNNNNVSYLQKVEYFENGNWEILKKPESRGQTHLTGDLWQWNNDEFQNISLVKDKGFEILMDKCLFKVNLDVELKLNFGGRNEFEFIADGVKVWRSKLLETEAYVFGLVTTKQNFRITGKSKFVYKEKEDDKFKQNIFPPLKVSFMVGNIPVVLTLNADMYRGASIETEGNFQAQSGYTFTTEGKLGLKWQQQSNNITPITSLKPNFSLNAPKISGQVETQAKTWFYPRVRCLLYGAFGLSFDFKPYLQTDVKGGFHEQLLSDKDDYCAWQMESYLGMNINAGINIALPITNTELGNKQIGETNVIHKKIFTSPHNIETINELENYQADSTYHIEFEVSDFNDLLQIENPTVLSQIVKFEGEGKMSKKYDIAKKGRVSLKWTPKKHNDELHAVLYDFEGTKIKSAIVNSKVNLYGSWEHAWIPYNDGRIKADRLILREDSTYTIYENLYKNTDGSESWKYSEISGKYTFKFEETPGINDMTFGYIHLKPTHIINYCLCGNNFDDCILDGSMWLGDLTTKEQILNLCIIPLPNIIVNDSEFEPLTDEYSILQLTKVGMGGMLWCKKNKDTSDKGNIPNEKLYSLLDLTYGFH